MIELGKVDDYREKLREIKDVEGYLLEESRLPGPRANLELAFAYAQEGDTEKFLEYAGLDAEEAPQNTRKEFLAFCGTLGLGYHLAQNPEYISILREKSSDPRWRIREAVALGLQRWGREHPIELMHLMFEWAEGSSLERRAVVAAICEPEVLKSIEPASRVFDLLDHVTSSIMGTETRDEGFVALRKALGYGWSVAVSVHPAMGKTRMEHWIISNDRDIRWVMKQNLKKKRMARMVNEWVSEQLDKLSKS